MHDNILWLQMFAEGADGSAATGGETSPASSEGAAAPAKASFEQLLEDPEYKAAYEKGVKGAVEKRLKTAKAQQKTMAPVVEMLALKHGIKPGDDGSYDLQAVANAFMGDRDYMYDMAAQLGYDSPEMMQNTLALQRENAEYKRQEEERARNAMWADVHRQGVELQLRYPDFNINEAMKNPAFAQAVGSGMFTVEQAYFAMNGSRLMTGAMQYAAQQTAESVSRAVQAGQARPKENGAGTIPAQITPDVRDPNVRAEIARRVARGEKVYL